MSVTLFVLSRSPTFLAGNVSSGSLGVAGAPEAQLPAASIIITAYAALLFAHSAHAVYQLLNALYSGACVAEELAESHISIMNTA